MFAIRNQIYRSISSQGIHVSPLKHSNKLGWPCNIIINFQCLNKLMVYLLSISHYVLKWFSIQILCHMSFSYSFFIALSSLVHYGTKIMFLIMMVDGVHSGLVADRLKRQAVTRRSCGTATPLLLLFYNTFSVATVYLCQEFVEYFYKKLVVQERSFVFSGIRFNNQKWSKL